MPPEFIAYLESLGFTDTSVIAPEQLAKLEAEWNRVAKLTAPPTQPLTLDSVLAARRAEEDRQQRIATLASDALRDYPGAAAQIEAVARLAAADPTWTDAKLELEILRSVRPQAGQFRPSARGVPEGEVLEAALALASKLPNIDKHYRPEILEQVDRMGLRSIGMGQALLMAAAANGMTTRPGETVNRGNVADALAYAFPPRHARLSGGFSTISLPNILSNLANKQSLEGFKETDQSWRLIARIRNARNFQKQTDHRLGGNNKLLPLGKGGEIKHGNLSEDTYERQISTKARQLAVTRQDLINDSLQAIQDLREVLSKGAAVTFLDDFWTVFMDNAAHFTTARKNYFAGTDTELLDDGEALQAAVTAFGKLKASDGTRLDGDAALIVCPPEVSPTAERFYKSQNLVGLTQSTIPEKNIHEGKYKPLKQSRLSDSDFEHSSTKAWYLMRTAADLAVVAVSFLDGFETPFYETAEADFDHDGGIRSKAVWDYGVDLAEWLAGVKMNGE